MLASNSPIQPIQPPPPPPRAQIVLVAHRYRFLAPARALLTAPGFTPDFTPPRYLEDACQTGVEIQMLLKHAFDLDSRTVSFAQAINGQVVSWTLGAMVVFLNIAPLDNVGANPGNPTTTAGRVYLSDAGLVQRRGNVRRDVDVGTGVVIAGVLISIPLVYLGWQTQRYAFV